MKVGRHEGGKGPTKEQQDRICELVRSGAYLETAAAAAGVCSRTIRGWVDFADQGAESLVPFRDAFLQAAAEAEHRAISLIDRAMQSDWRAAAWFLERRFPKRWGKDDRPQSIEAPQEIPTNSADPWQREGAVPTTETAADDDVEQK